MKNAIRSTAILLIMIIQTVLFGQDETPKLFKPTQIKADIDSLVSKLKDVHPTFLNHYKANNFKTKIDSIKNNIIDPMSSLDFFRKMQPFVVIDGHTTLRYTGELNPNEVSPLFPFKVIIFNNSLYVKENLSNNEDLVKGTMIEKINGVTSGEILKNLVKYTPGEKESYKIKKLEKDFHVFMALVYGSFSDFTVTVNKTEFKLKGASWDDFQEPSKPKFELRFYDNDIAYIYKRMFMPPKDFLHFMDSAFTVISQKQINHLIIDNLSGGGLTDLADSLMSYFTDKPYNLIEKKMTKISPFTKEFIEDKKSLGVIQDGYFIEEYPKHSSDRDNRFAGSTYILTGPLSYSTGTCFPAAAKNNQAAFIVGEESGQPLLSNGDGNQFELPETKIFCITALSKVYMPGHNNDEVTGVLPDYKVTPTLEDLLDDKEYTLEYTLKLIRENKVEKENAIDNKGYYFNQPLPVDSAVIFAPGIVSVNGRYEYGVSYSPDLKEIYFTAHRKDEGSSVYFSKLIDKKWMTPKKANLTKGVKKEEMEAFVNHSGDKIYFTAYDSRDVKIWQATRSGSWWTDPIQLDSPINEDIVFYSNEAKNGDLYYKNVSKGKMYYAPNKDGNFPEIFEAGIEYGSHGFIAPSQDFILIDAKKENDKTKDKDIHVCFKKEDGTWTKPINLGNTVNSNFNETCPSITPDGKYIFFSRYDEEGGLPNIYWVSTNIIDGLKEKSELSN